MSRRMPARWHLLADLERRRNGTNLDEFSQRYLAADPTGDVIAVLAPWRNDADFIFLQGKSLSIADFDFAANASRDTGALSGKRIATASLAASQVAAPDLWDNLVRDLSGDEMPGAEGFSEIDPGKQNTAPLAPFDPEPFQEADEVAAAVFGASMVTAALGNVDEVQEAAPVEPMIAASDIMSTNPEEAPALVSAVAMETAFTLSAEEEAGLADLMNAIGEPSGLEFGEAAVLVAAGDHPVSLNGNHSSGGNIDTYGATVPFTSDPLMGTVELTPQAPDEADINAALGIAPPDVNGSGGDLPESPLEPAAFNDPFVTADGRIDLTVGWDDLDRQLEAATPDAAAEGAFADLLAELNVDGIQPFDMDGAGPDDDAWAPLSAEDFGGNTEPQVAEVPKPVEVEAPAAFVDEQPVAPFAHEPASYGEHVLDPLREADVVDFAELNNIEPLDIPYGELDNDILAGIPQISASGYTEILRNIDEESPYVAFEAEAEEVFDSPDAAGTPLLFEELIEVTSKDGTGPLETDLHADIPENPFDFSGTDLEAALPPLEPEPMAYDLDGIVPFDTGALGTVDGFDGQAMSFAEIDRPVEVPVPPAPIFEPMSPTVALEPQMVEPTLVAPLTDAASDMAPFAFDDAPPADALASGVSFAELDQPVADFVAPIEMAASADSESDQVEAVETVSYTSLLRESVVVSIQEPEAQAPPAWAGREGLGPVAHKVLWPPFVNQTSSLIDRGTETDGLFARIAQQKESLVQMGVVSQVRTLQAKPVIVEVPVQQPVAEVAPAMDAPIIREVVDPPRSMPVMSDQTRKDLMAMRARLLDDSESAGEIAETIEKAMGEGLKAPLAQRVLGEAYLKLGQVERAAAQFRQAMLARRRT